MCGYQCSLGESDSQARRGSPAATASDPERKREGDVSCQNGPNFGRIIHSQSRLLYQTILAASKTGPATHVRS